MKKIIIIVLFLLVSSNLFATTYFATSSSVNINTANLWVPTSTGTCTGSGTALTWPPAAGDTLVANGCTAIALNVDPGSAGQVTLSTATNGGGFTYDTATNITMHTTISAGTTATLVITGSTGGGTIVGNVTGGSGSTTFGFNDSHTVVTMALIGNCTGGSGVSSFGCYVTANTGGWTITGNGYPGSGSHGIYVAGMAPISVVSVYGSDTLVSYGVFTNNATAAITVTGNIINGKASSATGGAIRWVPASATNYILYPKNSSYTLGTIDTNALEAPVAPSTANVKSGTQYGTLTGTLTGGGTVATVQ